MQVVEIRLTRLALQAAGTEMLFASWLTTEESIRLSTMRSETRRQQFIAGHWLARCMAAERTDSLPEEWRIVAAANGVPELIRRDPAAGQGMQLSLSHSGDHVAAAIAPFPIGIDIEIPRKQRDLLALADYTFSPEESAELQAVPADEQSALFYRFWTLKEASGKRDGHGLRPELARQQRALAASSETAEAISWQTGNVFLALAGKPGMQVREIDISAPARPLYWRFVSV